MDIKERDDKIKNPLNNIVLLAYRTAQYKQIVKEVNRILAVLEWENIITKRIDKKNDIHGIDG